ncbi:hypothetical protein, partial [Glutamicibacter arilaitensis]|uniref:hypothetical protein n=1 Tax=Glutamicibacter arilaitensis TaxID=256701 RepID=UPI003FD68CB2
FGLTTLKLEEPRKLDPAPGACRQPAAHLHRRCTEAGCFAHPFHGQFHGDQSNGIHEFVNGVALAKDGYAISIRNDLNIFASQVCSLNYQLLNSVGGNVGTAIAQDNSYTKKLNTKVPLGCGI